MMKESKKILTWLGLRSKVRSVVVDLRCDLKIILGVMGSIGGRGVDLSHEVERTRTDLRCQVKRLRFFGTDGRRRRGTAVMGRGRRGWG
jgi:hypothetical protein